MVISRILSTSFIASMLLIIRFIRTCCNCTRSAMISGRSSASLSALKWSTGLLRCAAARSFLNNFVYIKQFPFKGILLEEQADSSDDFRRTR